MKRLCDEAKSIGCAMVAINSSMTRICKELLKGTDIHVGAAISFPLGQTTLETKFFETKDAIDNIVTDIVVYSVIFYYRLSCCLTFPFIHSTRER